MHVNDFDDKYIPFARINDMLLCLHTTAANASEFLPPPKNYKEIHGRPGEEELIEACIKEFKNKAANNTFDLVKRQRKRSFAKPSGSSPTSWVLGGCDMESISTRPPRQLLRRHPSASSSR
eukprot:3320041-Pleurochrysis_carterae.AAC.1